MNPTHYDPSPLSLKDIANKNLDMLLRRTITANLSQDEHELFVNSCERSGLDPFARHIYPAKNRVYNPQSKRYEETYRPEATIDGLRLTAERTGKYAGQIGPDWCGKDGVWRDIWLDADPPAAARVGILRSDFQQPVWGKALFNEFVQLGPDGEPAPFWAKMATNQLAKCAEALGFRKAFPREFSGIYTRDEMAQAESLATPIRVAPAVPSDTALVASEHEGDYALASPSVPVPLRQFVNRGTADRKNVVEAFKFLEDELILVGGFGGAALFTTITSRLPRTFKTREACSAATVNCWLELWSEIEKGRRGKAA